MSDTNISSVTQTGIFDSDSSTDGLPTKHHTLLSDPGIRPDLLLNATGNVKIGLTNDYLFHIVFQENKLLLTDLLCALLSLPQEDIISVRVENPIIPGESCREKTIILDLIVLLNDQRIVNIEMQVNSQSFWSDRTLFYTCRSFMKLNRGEDYENLMPCIHIGILNFNLFPEFPEFHSKYSLLNDKNFSKFSDKLAVHVVNLPQVHFATAEDKASGLYDWAKLFRAATWEEIKMIAKDNETIQQAACAMCYYCADDKIYRECLGRQMEQMDKVSYHNSGIRKGKAEGKVEGMAAQKAADDIIINRQTEELAHLRAENERLKSYIKDNIPD